MLFIYYVIVFQQKDLKKYIVCQVFGTKWTSNNYFVFFCDVFILDSFSRIDYNFIKYAKNNLTIHERDMQLAL